MAFVPQLSQPIVIIAGPTASGKSDLAQQVALAIGGEIISADSMQVYRGMDIGTGKVPPAERLVPHWGLDLVDPGEPYSVAVYQEYARRAAADIDARGKRVVLCGGTGLYIRGVIDGYEYPKGDQVGNPVRDAYTELLGKVGPQALWEMLREKDPESAALLHPNNTKRVIRAFELLSEGTTYARQNANLQTIPQVLPAVYLALSVDPELLAARIEKRVDGMFEAGLAAEVQGLLDAGLREAVTAPQAIGYKEVVDALDGLCTMTEASERIKLASRRYAKRQRSWLRGDSRVRWLDANSPDGLLEAALREIDCAR
ncbi:MAG: tRNA (adenosine(37)-N6)-dimethylallyltransferase MiaA [Coriobacteriaceae bacterium]|nr:tRNA (adenosine(37)-N6)-dimethylallyltransferase MiaA [Coriobacteriaceae bacterium]